MDETSDEILEHIETQRNQLGTNLNELETRVRRTADWRTYFEHNPMLILAGAFGGGILLGRHGRRFEVECEQLKLYIIATPQEHRNEQFG